MIRSRPKKSTLFSLVLFLILAYSAGFWTALTIPSYPLYWYLIPVFCLSTALAVSIKVLTGYRVLVINRNRWKVKRLLRSDTIFNTKDIEWWQETEIKTAGGLYKQLHIQAKGGRNVKISLQEHTEYQKIYKEMKTNCPRKKIKENT